jgi:hypothetical protein
MHVCIMCLSHSIYHQHAAISIVTIFRVTYKNVRNGNNLSKLQVNHLMKSGSLIHFDRLFAFLIFSKLP